MSRSNRCLDGNPHPPRYQRLAPGMENFTDEHLVPQFGYVATSDGEVVEQVISQQPAESEDAQARRSILDDAKLQDQLQDQQDQQAVRQQDTPRRVSLSEQIEVETAPTVDLQGSGQVEGVRQMHQNAPRCQMATEMDLQACCRVGVSELTTSAYRDQESYRIVKGEEDITPYNAKKQTIEHSTFRDDSDDETPCTKRAKPRKRHRNLENANSLIEFFCEEGEDTASSEDSEIEASGEDSSIEKEEEECGSDSSSHSSSECSDAGITAHKTMSSRARRQISSSDEDDKKDDNIEDQTEQTQEEDTQSSSPQKPKRKENSETSKEQVESPATKSTWAKASTADHQDSGKSASSLSVTGFSSRSTRAKRRRVCDSSSSDLECSEDEKSPSNADDTDQNREPRKAFVAAVSKMKLMYASEEEDTSELKPAVIESSSESEEHDHQDDSPCQWAQNAQP